MSATAMVCADPCDFKRICSCSFSSARLAPYENYKMMSINQPEVNS